MVLVYPRMFVKVYIIYPRTVWHKRRWYHGADGIDLLVGSVLPARTTGCEKTEFWSLSFLIWSNTTRMGWILGNQYEWIWSWGWRESKCGFLLPKGCQYVSINRLSQMLEFIVIYNQYAVNMWFVFQCVDHTLSNYTQTWIQSDCCGCCGPSDGETTQDRAFCLVRAMAG